MPLAISEEQHQLADAVREFAARHAPISRPARSSRPLAAGQLPPWWQEFVDNGFHAVHVPERFGGQGGSLADMACVLEAAATALLPGPWLSTATAGAVALSGDIAEDDAAEVSLLRDLAGRRNRNRRAARAFRFPRSRRRIGLAVVGIVRFDARHLLGAAGGGPRTNR